MLSASFRYPFSPFWWVHLQWQPNSTIRFLHALCFSFRFLLPCLFIVYTSSFQVEIRYPLLCLWAPFCLINQIFVNRSYRNFRPINRPLAMYREWLVHHTLLVFLSSTLEHTANSKSTFVFNPRLNVHIWCSISEKWNQHFSYKVTLLWHSNGDNLIKDFQ